MTTTRLVIGATLVSLLFVSPAMSAERWAIGLTSNDAAIEATVVAGPTSSAPTVLLIGGMNGKDATTGVVSDEAASFETIPQNRRLFRLIAVPLANPDARPLQFPPTGIAYKDNAESHVLWRWIALQAPDLVVIAGEADSGLAAALSQSAAGSMGRIPAQIMAAKAGMLRSLPEPIAFSEAHREIERRRARSPRQVVDELAKTFGLTFDQPTYILAMALIGQLRLGNTASVIRVSEPYLNGSRDSFAMPSQSSLAAHMLFYEIAKRTGDERATKLVVRAANSGFTDDGSLREF